MKTIVLVAKNKIKFLFFHETQLLLSRLIKELNNAKTKIILHYIIQSELDLIFFDNIIFMKKILKINSLNKYV